MSNTTASVVAATAAALSLAWAFVFPAGYPWPSVAWAIVACAVVVAMVRTATKQPETMFDVIRGVEAEPGAKKAVAAAARPIL